MGRFVGNVGVWMVAAIAAEPIRAGTLRRFAEAFAPAGFRAEAFFPCYGLAEATLVVSSGRRDYEAAIQDADAGAIARGEFRVATGDSPITRPSVAC